MGLDKKTKAYLVLALLRYVRLKPEAKKVLHRILSDPMGPTSPGTLQKMMKRFVGRGIYIEPVIPSGERFRQSLLAALAAIEEYEKKRHPRVEVLVKESMREGARVSWLLDRRAYADVVEHLARLYDEGAAKIRAGARDTAATRGQRGRKGSRTTEIDFNTWLVLRNLAAYAILREYFVKPGSIREIAVLGRNHPEVKRIDASLARLAQIGGGVHPEKAIRAALAAADIAVSTPEVMNAIGEIERRVSKKVIDVYRAWRSGRLDVPLFESALDTVVFHYFRRLYKNPPEWKRIAFIRWAAEDERERARQIAEIEALMRGRKDPMAFERHLERVVRWDVKPRKTLGKYAEGV